jgi:uncharacterized membrane protein YGL010W
MTAGNYGGALSPELRQRFSEYDAYHLNKVNRALHEIGIPLILISHLGALGLLSLPSATTLGPAAPLLSAGGLVALLWAGWCLRYSVKYGVILLVVFLALTAVGARLPGAVLWTMAIIGWATQILGHLVWEKRSPNFTSNLEQLLVGPVYFLAIPAGDWRAPGHAAPAPEGSGSLRKEGSA